MEARGGLSAVELQLEGPGPWELGDDLKIVFQPGSECFLASFMPAVFDSFRPCLAMFGSVWFPSHGHSSSRKKRGQIKSNQVKSKDSAEVLADDRRRQS